MGWGGSLVTGGWEVWLLFGVLPFQCLERLSGIRASSEPLVGDALVKVLCLKIHCLGLQLVLLGVVARKRLPTVEA